MTFDWCCRYMLIVVMILEWYWLWAVGRTLCYLWDNWFSYIVFTEKKNNIANWFEFILDHHPINTTMTTNLTNNTVLVNEMFSITCSAQANPPAKYRFYKGNEYINGTDNDAVIITSVTERARMVNYSCIPFNFHGNGTKIALAVTVHCKYLIEWIP